MKELTINLGTLFNVKQTIDNSQVMKINFSKKGSVYIYKNYKVIVSELEPYESKRNDLIKKYSGGESITPDNPNWNAFIKELAELDLVDVTFNINTITTDDFPEVTTPDMFKCLDFMVEFEN